MRLFMRWLITAVALAAAVWLIPGIDTLGNNGWVAVLVMAAVLGFVNAFVKPILTFFSCGFILVTMGLFLLVVNAASLWIASWLSVNIFRTGLTLEGFWPALLGAIVVSIISFALNLFLADED
jgi:putative membrane protein